MKTVSIDLENCYGIKKLQAEFDFSKAKACAVYAPNGSMKSSLAQTFQDVADGVASKDRIFPARACRREIKDEAGADLPKTIRDRPRFTTVSHGQPIVFHLTATSNINALTKARHKRPGTLHDCRDHMRRLLAQFG